MKHEAYSMFDGRPVRDVVAASKKLAEDNENLRMYLNDIDFRIKWQEKEHCMYWLNFGDQNGILLIRML